METVILCRVQFLSEPDYDAKKALEIVGLEKTIQMQKDVSCVFCAVYLYFSHAAS